MTAKRIQAAKSVAKTYQRAFASAAAGNLIDVLARFTSDDFLWRGVHPFNEQRGDDGQSVWVIRCHRRPALSLFDRDPAATTIVRRRCWRAPGTRTWPGTVPAVSARPTRYAVISNSISTRFAGT